MDAAFLAVVRKHESSMWEHRRDVTARADPSSSLGFRARGHLSWCDPGGSVAVGAWQGPPVSPAGTAWEVGDDGVVVPVGMLRWRHRTWLPEGRWASEVARAATGTSLRDLCEQLRGVFALARASRDGRVEVIADPVGLRCVYYGETDDAVAVASKASLVAAALGSPDRPAPRDLPNACWLAFTTYRIGTATGYEGVSVLPPGSALTIDRGGVLTVDRARPWDPGDGLRTRSHDELVDLARDEIADGLRATLELPVDRRVFRLTGGKDSRLLLAVALWSGVAKEFDYETIGPPTLPDVQVARELADVFDLRHEARFIGMRSTRPYADRVRDFVAATGGMLNIWDLAEPNASAHEVQVVGLFGEPLRSFTHGDHSGLATEDDLVDHIARQPFGRLGLVRAHVVDDLRRRTVEDLLDGAAPRDDPRDLLHAFYFRNRVRLSRMGPQEELGGQRRVLPLYAIDALRAAIALGPRAREHESLHHEIIRRCAPALADHRFAGRGWDTPSPRPPSGAVEHRSAPPAPAPARGSRARPGTRGPLMQRLQQSAFDERASLFTSIVDDRTNPMWDLLDRRATAGALARFADLSNLERRELYGALTAALWARGGP
jgi:hypothetical protein